MEGRIHEISMPVHGDLRQEMFGVKYPSAPWRLQGFAIQCSRMVNVVRVRPLIPPELEIVSLLPGKTLGMIYIASYGPGSVVEYNELGVIVALVRYGDKTGLWSSHIYVDNVIPLIAGREIWGLPKELAEFAWEEGKRHCVVIYQEEKILCTLRWGRQFWMRRLGASMPGFTVKDSHLLYIRAETEGYVGLSSSKLTIPSESPLATLDLGQGLFTVHQKEMCMIVGKPQPMGEAQRVPSEKRGLFLTSEREIWRSGNEAI